MSNPSKSDVITDILRQHGTLPVRDIVQEMQSRGVEANSNSVRSLMSSSFKRFTSLVPGLWQLQDPSLSQAERVLAYNQFRSRAPGLPLKISEVSPETKGFMECENTIKVLNQILQQRQKQIAWLLATIEHLQVVIAEVERVPDDFVTILEADVESVGNVVTPTQTVSVKPKSRRVKREPVDSKTLCPRCSATAVVMEEGSDWSICLSCGWNSSEVAAES